jgi:DNA polymerase III alpha subunit
MGKKKPEVMAKCKKEFMEGCARVGTVDPTQSAEIFGWIEKGQRYSFNRCLAGDETILRTCSPEHRLTIEELYRIKNDLDYAKSVGRESLRHKFVNTHGYGSGLSMCADDIIRTNVIRDIQPAGVRPVYKITLHNGATIRATANHKFPTPMGERLLQELSAGDLLYVKDKRGRKAGTSTIMAVEMDGVTNTYDVTMDAPNHNLVTQQGIVTSNSHSISYAMLSYQTAYCKAHFPTEFFVQGLIFAANKSDPMEERYILIRDAQNFGITIRPPDIRLKNSDFIIDPTTSNAIIFGLAHIKGISAATIDRLMKLSMGTWGQFIAAIPAIRRNYALALVQSGACDCYGLPRTYMANVVKAVIDNITDRESVALTPLVESSGDISTALKTLAAGGHLARLNKNRRAVLEGLAETLSIQTPDTTKQRALLEHWYLGASVSCSAADGVMDANDVQRCSDFVKIPNGKSLDLCVVIERVKISKTRKGQAMCFLTISDSSGGIDHCPVFPDAYSTCQDKCQPQAVIVLGGTKRNGSLIVESIRELVGT